MIPIILVTLWLLPLSQSLETVTSIHPTSIPTGLPTYGISIFIDGSGFSNSTSYSCKWSRDTTYVVTTNAQFISSTSLICQTPNFDASWLGNSTSGSLTLSKPKVDISKAVIQFEISSSCLSEAFPWCGVHGDPHFKPFCVGDLVPSSDIGYPIQPSNVQLNLVTSKDGRFKVYGRTTPTCGTLQVSSLNSISIIGPGAGGYLSPNITFDSPPTKTIITVGGVVITPDQLPYNINEITIGRAKNNWYYVEFPNKENVLWNGVDTVYIYLPGTQYWQNVYGLCGEIDVSYDYCKGQNGQQYSGDTLNTCGYTWVVPYGSTVNVPNPQPTTPNPNIVIPKPIPSPNVVIIPEPTPVPGTVPNPQPQLTPNPDTVPNPQPTPYPDTVPNPQPEPTPYPGTVPNPQPQLTPNPNTVPNPQVITPEPTPIPDIVIIPEPAPIPYPIGPLPPAYVVPDNFVSKVIKTICSAMFGVLEDVCPADYQQNLPVYESSCVYDGAALLSYRFDQLHIDASIIDHPESFFTNAAQLAETVFDESTYSFMVSSVRAGIHDCFIQAQNISLEAPVFKVNEFFEALPGCSSYCKFPGALCSPNGDCQLSLTLTQLIALAAGLQPFT